MANILVNSAGKLLKAAVGKETIEKIAEPAGRMIEQAVDRHFANQKMMIEVPDLRELKLQEAKEYLERLGFTVHPVLQAPHSKYKNKMSDTVVAMSPKAGKIKPNTLFKLYYVNQDVIRDSHKTIDLPDVVGMSLANASRLLESIGLIPVPILLTPRKEHAGRKTGTVLRMSPTPTVLSKQVKRGSVIKLRYLDDGTLEQSRTLRQTQRQKLARRNEQLAESIDKTKRVFQKKKK